MLYIKDVSSIAYPISLYSILTKIYQNKGKSYSNKQAKIKNGIEDILVKIIRDANAITYNKSDDKSNYLAYAIYPLLLNKQRDNLNIFNKLINKIVTNLKFSYKYSSDAFLEKLE